MPLNSQYPSLQMLAIGKRGKKNKEASEPGKARVVHKPTGEIVIVNDDPQKKMYFKLMRHGESKDSRDLLTLHPSGEYPVQVPGRAYAWLCYHHQMP